MEWFIPSAFVILLAAIVCFIVLPRLSPYILGSVALVLFLVGSWQHYKMFPYEYRLSLITDLLRDYSPFVMLFSVIFGGMIAIMLAFGVKPPSMSNVIPQNIPDMMPEVITNILPGANTKVSNNTSKGANAKSGNNASKAANNTGLMGFINGANNTKRNNIASQSFKTV